MFLRWCVVVIILLNSLCYVASTPTRGARDDLSVHRAVAYLSMQDDGSALTVLQRDLETHKDALSSKSYKRYHVRHTIIHNYELISLLIVFFDQWVFPSPYMSTILALAVAHALAVFWLWRAASVTMPSGSSLILVCFGLALIAGNFLPGQLFPLSYPRYLWYLGFPRASMILFFLAGLLYAIHCIDQRAWKRRGHFVVLSFMLAALCNVGTFMIIAISLLSVAVAWAALRIPALGRAHAVGGSLLVWVFFAVTAVLFLGKLSMLYFPAGRFAGFVILDDVVRFSFWLLFSFLTLEYWRRQIQHGPPLGAIERRLFFLYYGIAPLSLGIFLFSPDSLYYHDASLLLMYFFESCHRTTGMVNLLWYLLAAIIVMRFMPERKALAAVGLALVMCFVFNVKMVKDLYEQERVDIFDASLLQVKYAELEEGNIFASEVQYFHAVANQIRAGEAFTP